MSAHSFSIFGISGSFRGTSFNSMLMRRAVALAPEDIEFDLFADIGEIPHFSQDREGEMTPAVVDDFRARIEAADAILVATPEYNGSMPGVLKNALDWASRPAGESVLAGKPAAVLGASPGRFGASRAQADVRKVLTAIGAEVVDQELPIARAQEVFDEQGAVIDEGSESGIAAHVALLVEFAGGPTPGEPKELATYSLECQRALAG
jgi:chromate reductase